MSTKTTTSALVQHLYEGECPDNWNGPAARDVRCPACRALDAPVQLVVEIDRPTDRPAAVRVYRDGDLVFDGTSSHDDAAAEVSDGFERRQVTALVVERSGRRVPAASETTGEHRAGEAA